MISPTLNFSLFHLVENTPGKAVAIFSDVDYHVFLIHNRVNPNAVLPHSLIGQEAWAPTIFVHSNACITYVEKISAHTFRAVFYPRGGLPNDGNPLSASKCAGRAYKKHGY